MAKREPPAVMESCVTSRRGRPGTAAHAGPGLMEPDPACGHSWWHRGRYMTMWLPQCHIPLMSGHWFCDPCPTGGCRMLRDAAEPAPCPAQSQLRAHRRAEPGSTRSSSRSFSDPGTAQVSAWPGHERQEFVPGASPVPLADILQMCHPCSPQPQRAHLKEQMVFLHFKTDNQLFVIIIQLLSQQ